MEFTLSLEFNFSSQLIQCEHIFRIFVCYYEKGMLYFLLIRMIVNQEVFSMAYGRISK